jgi:hypothetical protein
VKKNSVLLLGVSAAVATAVAGCGGSSASPPSAQSTVTGFPPTSVIATPTGAPPTTESAPATTAPTSSAVPSTSQPPQAPTHIPIAACTQAELAVGTFQHVLYSEGAGHTSADLAFRNTSQRACTVSGFPRLTLYTVAGAALPTSVTDVEPAPAAALTVAPGSWIHSELRYTPHIPGPTEPQTGPCEPAAAYLLVRLPGDSTSERVNLPTRETFCVRGQIDAKPFLDGPASPVGG